MIVCVNWLALEIVCNFSFPRGSKGILNHGCDMVHGGLLQSQVRCMLVVNCRKLFKHL